MKILRETRCGCRGLGDVHEEEARESGKTSNKEGCVLVCRMVSTGQVSFENNRKLRREDCHECMRIVQHQSMFVQFFCSNNKRCESDQSDQVVATLSTSQPVSHFPLFLVSWPFLGSSVSFPFSIQFNSLPSCYQSRSSSLFFCYRCFQA